MTFDYQSSVSDLSLVVFPNFPFANQPDQGIGPGPVQIAVNSIQGGTDQGNQIQGKVNNPNP